MTVNFALNKVTNSRHVCGFKNELSLKPVGGVGELGGGGSLQLCNFDSNFFSQESSYASIGFISSVLIRM